MIGFPKSRLLWDNSPLAAGLQNVLFDHGRYFIANTNFTFLFATLWWYVSPFAIPPLTNLLTLFILTAPKIRLAAAAAMSSSQLGRAAFYSIFGMVTFRQPFDVLFFGTSFLYKSIILESKMGPRRYFFLIILSALATGLPKFALDHFDKPDVAGPYMTLIAFKIMIFRWAKEEHPIRFPHTISVFARKVDYLEYLLIAIASRDPKELALGAIVGTALSRIPFTQPEFLPRVLGSVTALPYIRVLVSGPRRVAQVLLYFLPKVSAVFLIGSSLAQYFCRIFPEGVNLFCAIPSGQLHMLLMPSFSVINLTHLIYTCFSAYVVMYHMHKIFHYQFIMALYCVLLQVLTNILYVAVTNLSYKCPPFSNQCVPPGTEITGITSTLLALQVFGGVMRHKPEWRNYALTALRACGEVVLIYAFLPEIDPRLHLIGAAAGFALALTHQRPPPFIRRHVPDSDITIERPYSGVSAKITGRSRSEYGDTPGRKSRITINTRPAANVAPRLDASPSMPVLPPKVILILGQSPPMYVPVNMQQGSHLPLMMRPPGPTMIRSRMISPMNHMQNRLPRNRPPQYRP